jgi:hypothetical protein
MVSKVRFLFDLCGSHSHSGNGDPRPASPRLGWERAGILSVPAIAFISGSRAQKERLPAIAPVPLRARVPAIVSRSRAPRAH